MSILSVLPVCVCLHWPHMSPSFQILGYFDYAFTAIFTVEILIKVNAPWPCLCALDSSDCVVTLWPVLLPQVLGYADYVFTSMFTFEILLKVNLWYPVRRLESCFCTQPSLMCHGHVTVLCCCFWTLIVFSFTFVFWEELVALHMFVGWHTVCACVYKNSPQIPVTCVVICFSLS